MSSEIRTNLLKSRAGLSTVTLSDTGPVVTGIATFGVTTKIDGGNNVINVGTALTIGHTQGVQFLTQNLHSTGFEVNQVNASGIITASSYRGDGSQLTGISGVTINNNADNRIITGGSGVNLNAEANLVWDGSQMGVGHNNPTDTFHVYHATDNLVARFESGDTGGGITLKDNTHVTSLLTTNGAFEINVDQGGDISGETIAFKMSGSEKLRITSSGNVNIGNALSNTTRMFAVENTLADGGEIAYIGNNDGGSNYGGLIISAGETDRECRLESAWGNSFITFYTNTSSSTEKLRITSDGLLQLNNDAAKIQLGASQDLSIYHDGSSNRIIAANADLLVQSQNYAIRSENGSSTYLNIDSSGRVIIGGTSPLTDAQLTLSAADAPALAFQRTGSGKFESAIGMEANSALRFYVGADSSTVSGLTEAMQIDASGKLLVGATSGSSHHISSGSDTLNTVFQANLGGAGATCAIRIKMNTSANNGLQIQQNGSGTSISGGAHAASIFNRENGKLRFGTNNTERFTIESNGHVYAQSQFTVKGELNMHSATTAAKYMDIGFQNNSFNMRRTNASDGGHSNFITVNASKVVSGNFNDTSDGKLKKNVATISDGAIEDIKKLRPVTFDWIDETENDNVSGFIAQEVKQVLPNLVDGTEYDPSYNDESLGSKGGIKSVGYSINSVGVTAHLTKAVQELIAKVEKLEQENIALRIRLTNLEDN